MDAWDWLGELEDRYCDTPYYLAPEIFKDNEFMESFGSLQWDGSVYPELFYVTISYDPESLLIKGFEVQRMKELSDDARGSYLDRPVSREKARDFLRSFKPYVRKEPGT